MKSISKKIKTIYLLAMMAILSICIAVFPVFKTESVKAEEDPGLSMTGAYVQFSTKNGIDDFALMFQAKITKTFYDTIADQNVKFGIAIGPKTALESITTFEGLDDISDGSTGNAWVFDSLIGTTSSSVAQKIRFNTDETFVTYEAGVYFNKTDVKYEGKDAAWWNGVYALDLTAIPFYTNGDTVVFDATLGLTKNVKQLTLDTMLAENAKPVNYSEDMDKDLRRAVSDDIFTAITGYTLNHQFEGADIYLSKTKLAFLADIVKGVQDDTQKDQRFLRYWAPSKSGTNVSIPVGSVFGGTKLIKVFCSGGTTNAYNTQANVLFTASQKRVEDPTAISKLIPGETYRAYYVDGTTLNYFEYMAITGAFVGMQNGSTAHDLNVLSGVTIDNGATASVQSYFALGLDIEDDNTSTVYTPYTFTSKGTYTDETGYNGYYVLGGDMIVEDPTVGSASLTPGHTYTTFKSFNVQPAPKQGTGITNVSIGALKHANYWTDNLDLEAVANANVGFTGVFDGRGYTLDTSFARGGIFGVINGGTVKNLNIKADFYQYGYEGEQVNFSKNSYSEKSAVLAEAILDGSTIENVAIELVEPAPTTFNVKGWNADTSEITNRPEMDEVKAILAAEGIYGANTTLKNVIVRCDTLQYVGNSIQNYRSALNVDSSVKNIDNLFVIGSSYTNMTIDNDYTLTISVPSLPEGVEEGQVVALKDNAALLAKYGDMIYDMYKWMRNENIIDADTGLTKAKIKFVLEPATKKFATEADFQAYLNGDGAADKAELIATGLWKEKDGSLIWAEEVIKGTTYDVVPQASGFIMAEPLVPTFEDYYGWSANFGEGLTYNVRVTLADGTAKSFTLA